MNNYIIFYLILNGDISWAKKEESYTSPILCLIEGKGRLVFMDYPSP
jgi:hypothetical protein